MDFRKIYREAKEDIVPIELRRKINDSLPTALKVVDERTKSLTSIDDIINYFKTDCSRPNGWVKLAEKVFDGLGISKTFDDGKSIFGSSTPESYATKIIFAYIDDIYYKHIKNINIRIKLLSNLLTEFPEKSIEDIYNYINRNKGNFEYSKTEEYEDDEYDEEAPEMTQRFIFQKVYENDDMIEPETDLLETEIDDEEALNIATCYLQDSAWSYFEGYDDEDFEDDFRDWFVYHSNVQLDDEMVNDYQGVDPSDRF